MSHTTNAQWSARAKAMRWEAAQQLEQTAAKEGGLQLAIVKAFIFPLKLCGIVKNPHLSK